MLYRISRIFEYEHFMDVEADSLEEAMQKVDDDDVEYYEGEGGEHWLGVERWKCADAEPRKEDEEENEYLERVEEAFMDEDWNVKFNTWD